MATSDKYDRQLRLWGANGQRALAEASVLLIGADGVGSETLKNLVLPGIGSFTILDDKVDTIGYVSKIVVVKYMGHRLLCIVYV
jgi:amyloid beta precursor protein binding protein 1